MTKLVCDICPHSCKLGEGQLGFCQARKNKEGKIVSINYGKITAMALDPIEKKPLYHFYPGTNILSVGSFACNLRCPHCQNYRISMARDGEIEYKYISPETLLAYALEANNNIGIAYTYNEPLISYEYIMDTAKLARENGLVNCLVTNGYINPNKLLEILPRIDAINIDLKAFNQSFYKKIKGDLEVVKESIKLANDYCHLEVTALIIPGENDSIEEMEEMALFLASINPKIPLHISRFFPRYKSLDKEPTSIETIYQLADIAKGHLEYVYRGNC